MNTSNKSIDQLLKDKLSDNGLAWNDGEWAAFNNKYKEGKKKRGIAWWSASVSGAILILGFTIWGLSNWGDEQAKVELPVFNYSNSSISKSENVGSNNNVENSLVQEQPNSGFKQTPQVNNIYNNHISVPQIKKYLVVEKDIVPQSNIVVNENKQSEVIEATNDAVEVTKPVENIIPDNLTITPPQATQPVPNSNLKQRFVKKKNPAEIIYYIEPIFMVGTGALGSETIGNNIISANNHSRDFASKYNNGIGINMGLKLNKHWAVETGIAQQKFTENYSRNRTENIVVYTNKSYRTLKVDTATGKINSAPVTTTTKHDSMVNHTDKSVNIYSYVQIPLMIYYHTSLNKNFNIVLGAGSAINIMQLKNRNANELYGYDPTGNMIQPKMFISVALKGGLEWKPLPRLSFTLNESIAMGIADNDIYRIKLKQYATQVGMRFYIKNK